MIRNIVLGFFHNEKKVLTISQTLQDLDHYRGEWERINAEICTFQANMNKIDGLLGNDVKKKVQTSDVLSRYNVALREIKSVLLNIKELDRQNKVYVAEFNNSFTTFKSNQPNKSKKSAIKKLNKFGKVCAERLSLAQKERYGKIAVINLMKVELEHRNTYLVNLAKCLEQNDDLDTVSYDGKRLTYNEEIRMQSIRLKYSQLEDTKKIMNIRREQWPSDMEELLGKDLPFVTGKAPEKDTSKKDKRKL